MRYNIYSRFSGFFLCTCTEDQVCNFPASRCIVARLVGGDRVYAQGLKVLT